MRWFSKNSRLENSVVALIAAAIVYQIFVDPIVGTADNYDWWRVLKQVGLEYDSQSMTFFNFGTLYKSVPKEEVAYLTSQLILTKVAVVLSDVFSKDGSFDLRWMGFVNGIAYLAAIRLFIAGFHRRAIWVRIVVALASIVMFTDVRIVAYFNSFYCEPAQITFLLAAIGFLLLTCDELLSDKRRRYFYVLFVTSSILFFFAKTQDLVFCGPFAVIAATVLPWRCSWKVRGAVAVLFVSLLVWGIKSDAYAVTYGVNIQVHLDEELLANSRTPAKDLQELGGGDRNNVTFARLAVFYAKRPARWFRMANRRLKEAFSNVPYGNFEYPARGESQAFDVFSTWKKNHYPRSIFLWAFAAVAYLGLLLAKTRLGDTHDRPSTVINAMLVLSCVLQFIAVVTFEANGTEKHFFIFNVLVDIVLLLSVFEIARFAILGWKRVGRSPSLLKLRWRSNRP